MDPLARASGLPITNTSGSFTQPPPGGLVTVSLNTSTWMNAGQEIFIQSGGSYVVNSIPDGTSASLRNPGYAGNTVAGASIASGANVYQIGSRWNTGVADSDNALTPTVNLDIATFTVTAVGYVSSVTVQRAANITPYSSNDVIGGVLTLTSIGPTSGHIIITSIDLILNIAAVPAGIGLFTLYLYSATPPSVLNDNDPFSLPSGDRASCISPGGISLGTPALAQGGGSVVLQLNNINQQYRIVSGAQLFAYLVTNNGFTPAANSETYTLRVRSAGV